MEAQKKLDSERTKRNLIVLTVLIMGSILIGIGVYLLLKRKKTESISGSDSESPTKEEEKPPAGGGGSNHGGSSDCPEKVSDHKVKDKSQAEGFNGGDDLQILPPGVDQDQVSQEVDKTVQSHVGSGVETKEPSSHAENLNASNDEPIEQESSGVGAGAQPSNTNATQQNVSEQNSSNIGNSNTQDHLAFKKTKIDSEIEGSQNHVLDDQEASEESQTESPDSYPLLEAALQQHHTTPNDSESEKSAQKHNQGESIFPNREGELDDEDESSTYKKTESLKEVKEGECQDSDDLEEKPEEKLFVVSTKNNEDAEGVQTSQQESRNPSPKTSNNSETKKTKGAFHDPTSPLAKETQKSQEEGLLEGNDPEKKENAGGLTNQPSQIPKETSPAEGILSQQDKHSEESDKGLGQPSLGNPISENKDGALDQNNHLTVVQASEERVSGGFETKEKGERSQRSGDFEKKGGNGENRSSLEPLFGRKQSEGALFWEGALKKEIKAGLCERVNQEGQKVLRSNSRDDLGQAMPLNYSSETDNKEILDETLVKDLSMAFEENQNDISGSALAEKANYDYAIKELEDLEKGNDCQEGVIKELGHWIKEGIEALPEFLRLYGEDWEDYSRDYPYQFD